MTVLQLALKTHVDFFFHADFQVAIARCIACSPVDSGTLQLISVAAAALEPSPLSICNMAAALCSPVALQRSGAAACSSKQASQFMAPALR